MSVSTLNLLDLKSARPEGVCRLCHGGPIPDLDNQRARSSMADRCRALISLKLRPALLTDQWRRTTSSSPFTRAGPGILTLDKTLNIPASFVKRDTTPIVPDGLLQPFVLRAALPKFL